MKEKETDIMKLINDRHRIVENIKFQHKIFQFKNQLNHFHRFPGVAS